MTESVRTTPQAQLLDMKNCRVEQRIPLLPRGLISREVAILWCQCFISSSLFLMIVIAESLLGRVRLMLWLWRCQHLGLWIICVFCAFVRSNVRVTNRRRRGVWFCFLGWVRVLADSTQKRILCKVGLCVLPSHTYLFSQWLESLHEITSDSHSLCKGHCYSEVDLHF